MISRFILVAALSACAAACSVTDIQNHRLTNSRLSTIKDLSDLTVSLKRYDLDKTLLVLDIDDTLLTSSAFFGSDRWYEWQSGKGKDEHGNILAISQTQSISCRFDVLGITYEIAANQPTQENAAAIVKALNIDKLVLTARSDRYRAATHRELTENGFSFGDEHLLPFNEIYRESISEGGRTAHVSYIDGVYMVAGLNKGKRLTHMLDKIHKEYSNVILVDDKLDNINNVRIALAQKGIDFHGYHYTRVNKSISAKDIKEGEEAAQKLDSYIARYFSGRSSRLSGRHCSY